MKAVILAGGLGTRLRPLTDNLPKPVVQLGNRPFAEYQIEILRKAGIEEIIFSLGYRSEHIEAVLGDGSRLGVSLKYATEPAPLGTAGAYSFAGGDNSGPVFVLNGDILTDIDLSAMMEIHHSRAATATLFLKEVPDPTLYGLVEVDGSGRVTGFREKPSAEEAAALAHPLINAGIYLLEPTVSELIPPGLKCMFEHDVFPALIARGDFVASFAPECYWRDIGTIENYRIGNIDSLNPPFGSGLDRMIGANCSISDDADIFNSVVGDDVTIGKDSVVKDSVIHSGSSIGERCRIHAAVVGNGCTIGDDVELGPGTVLGDGTDVPK